MPPRLSLPALLAAAACTATPAVKVKSVPAPQPAELRITIARSKAETQTFVEKIAAACWLDTELRADALIVDKATGRMIMVAGEDEVLIARLRQLGPERTRLTLTGPAMQDPARAARMTNHLRRAEDTGETAC